MWIYTDMFGLMWNVDSIIKRLRACYGLKPALFTGPGTQIPEE